MIIKPLENLNTAILDISKNDSTSDIIEKTSNDEIGKLVDSFNGYIGKLKAGYEEDAKVIEEVDSVIEKVNNGFYVYKIEKTSSNQQVMKLRNSINSMILKTNENLTNLNNILMQYGTSDFTPNLKLLESSKASGIIFFCCCWCSCCFCCYRCSSSSASSKASCYSSNISSCRSNNS